MMNHYLYSPFELAAIIYSYELNIEEYTILLQKVHRYDNSYLIPEYRQDRKQFILAVMDKLAYISDPQAYIAERADVEKDMNAFGLDNNDASQNDLVYSNMFFKELRIKIKYINTRGFARMKLRTLLSELKYKRRSSSVMDYIQKCLYFYHIEVTLKGNQPCDLKECSLDDVVIFKVI